MSQKVKIYKKKIQIWSEDNNWAFDWSHFALRDESLICQGNQQILIQTLES